MDDTTQSIPTEDLQRFPHMFPLDIKIWKRFLAKYSADYDSFSYDIKVGSGSPVKEGTPENYARMQEILSKYRIDTVGFRSGGIDIIEVKPDAGTIAIGQVVTYVALYRRDLHPDKTVRGVIVTDRELPDMKNLTKQLGFGYYIV